MRLIKGENTALEQVVRRIVRKCGVRQRSNDATLPGRPDIVVPSKRKIILVHGCFWHRHNCKKGKRMPKTNSDYWSHKFLRNRQRDRAVLNELASLGWDVLIAWECQLQRLGWLEKRIRKFLA